VGKIVPGVVRTLAREVAQILVLQHVLETAKEAVLVVAVMDVVELVHHVLRLVQILVKRRHSKVVQIVPMIVRMDVVAVVKGIVPAAVGWDARKPVAEVAVEIV